MGTAMGPLSALPRHTECRRGTGSCQSTGRDVEERYRLNLEQHRTLAANLRRRLAGEVGDCGLIETHISSVLLAGGFAYKIKKPVDLGFLDFSTLERRRHFCQEEVRLNRRLEPEIYLEVVPVTGTLDAPRIGGDVPVLDYAVRMRRFDQDGVLANHPERLTPAWVDRLARRIAAFHQEIARAGPEQPYGDAEGVLAPMLQNFRQIRALWRGDDIGPRLDALERWTRTRFERLLPLLHQRKEGGWIRECHGDLHLGNIALDHGRLILFDGIEFNPGLRWIDIQSELAFLLMDLDEHRLPGVGWRLLNRYLEEVGDYPGLPLLRFYQCYRAMVRAKVAAIGLGQAATEEGRRAFLGYLELAAGYTADSRPALLITHGFSGSGKSTETESLLAELPAVRIRSDVERKRLAGLPAGAESGAAPGEGIYSGDFTRATYRRLLDLARVMLEAGFSVVVDATFLEREWRQPFEELARRQGVPFAILDFQVPEDELRRRVAARSRRGGDASEADLAILERQLASAVPPTGEERGLLWQTIHPRRLDVDGLRRMLWRE